MKQNFYHFKKVFLSLLFLIQFYSIDSFGVNKLSESFTSPTFPPTGWISVHNMGIGGDWFRSTTGFRSSPACAQSDAGILSDNWLITKSLTPDSNDSLIFYVSSNYLLGALGRLEVKISTTNNSVSSFFDFIIPFQLNLHLLTPNVYVRQAIGLSAYAGQTIYLAFRHIEVAGLGGAVRLDNVSVGGVVLNLTVLLEGHVFSPTPRDRDTLTVSLRHASAAPYTLVGTSKVYLDTLGKGTFEFNEGEDNIPYYIVVEHRNHLRTWSRAGGEIFTGGTLTYDFTTGLDKAFGNNMKIVLGKVTLFTGDIQNDGIVDASDISGIDNAVFAFTFAPYEVTDLNWDEFCDASDLSLVDNNAYLLVIEKAPPP